MVDIHSHILPGVDDGSRSIDESRRMLLAAAEGGTQVICATPHFDRRAGYANFASDELEGRFAALCRMAERERIPVRIARGMEVLAEDDLPELLSDGLVWTLAGTRYILAEFRIREDPAFCADVLWRTAKAGYMPVVAHPERYRFVQDRPQTAYEWCRSGFGLQINRGSITGSFGEAARVTALRLIGHGLAACIASDAHGADRRTAGMADVKRIVKEEFGADHADLLFEDNPQRMLAGRELMGLEPYPFV